MLDGSIFDFSGGTRRIQQLKDELEGLQESMEESDGSLQAKDGIIKTIVEEMENMDMEIKALRDEMRECGEQIAVEEKKYAEALAKMKKSKKTVDRKVELKLVTDENSDLDDEDDKLLGGIRLTLRGGGIRASKPYIKVRQDGKTIPGAKSRVVKNSTEPEWSNLKFWFEDVDVVRELEFSVWDKGFVGGRRVGGVRIYVSDLVDLSKTYRAVTMELKDDKGQSIPARGGQEGFQTLTFWSAKQFLNK